METGYLLQISAELTNLAEIRRFIQSKAAILGLGSEAIIDVILAVDEAVTNVIVHGYRKHQGSIDIEVDRDKDTLIVRIRDHAPMFDPTRLPPPDINLPLEQRPLGGMGVYLMRELMDNVTHRVTPQGGNELTLEKRIVPK